jgi:transcriptional regulator with XRE-family HTH domain
MVNDTLKTARLSLRLSQEEFAKRIRDAGKDAGEPNGASKRLIARWEAGESTPRPIYARALERVTGVPIEALGFPARVAPDRKGGHDVTSSESAGEASTEVGTTAEINEFSGIWVSRYEFYSSGRNEAYIGAHHVLLLQTGDRITGRSISPNSLDAGSSLTFDLSVERNVITGSWRERTGPEGYYTGATYHGAVQLLAEPTGRRLTGKWVGFGKDMDVNSGPWELSFLNASTTPAAIERYSEPPTA